MVFALAGLNWWVPLFPSDTSGYGNSFAPRTGFELEFGSRFDLEQKISLSVHQTRTPGAAEV